MSIHHEVLQLAVDAGEILLKNGAEIFRVQETIEHILNAFQVSPHSVYVVSNGIFATFNEDGTDRCFALRDVRPITIHLGRIDAVNDLSRAIVRNPDPALLPEYRKQLDACAAIPFFPLWMQLLSCGLGSGCFCLLFGGNYISAVATFLCGSLLQLFLVMYSKKKRPLYLNIIWGAILVSSLAFGITRLIPSASLDPIIIGAIISLMPGVALTTAMRDYFNGDVISGNNHLTDALLTGGCIAVGVGMALWFWECMVGGVFL